MGVMRWPPPLATGPADVLISWVGSPGDVPGKQEPGWLGCNPGKMVVEGAEGCGGQRLLSGGAERAETCDTNGIGSPVQEFGSLSDVGAGGGKVAALQFGSGEVDQNQHALPAPGQARIADRSGEYLACVAVVAGP